MFSIIKCTISSYCNKEYDKIKILPKNIITPPKSQMIAGWKKGYEVYAGKKTQLG